MSSHDPLKDLTPREAAKLTDLASRGMGHQMGRDAGLKDSLQVNENVAAEALGEAQETLNLQQGDLNRASVLNPLSPSVQGDNQDVVKKEEAADPDALDVDMFSRGNVGRVVEELRAQKIEEQYQLAAKKAGLPFVRVVGYPISPDVLGMIPADLAKSGRMFAYLRAGKKVRLAIQDPFREETKKALQILHDNTPYDYLIAVAGEDSFRYAMKLYDELPHARTEAGDVQIEKGARGDFDREIKNIKDLTARIKEVPTTKLIDILLTGALKVGASDVHVEPREKGVKIRYRLDGVLQDVIDMPTTSMNAIVNRLKFLAKLKLDLNRMPQDGRFTIKDEDAEVEHEIDIRVATIPVQYGEAITMRLLDRDSLNISMDSLGLTGEPLRKVMDALKRPQGLILECGPTGSGKTTTLYALLSLLNDPGKKLITLEDPIEYRMDGVLQSQVQPEHGYDFGEGFRSILRLDPDIVMVGEIRDNLTAEMATQASLTGHVVLSTLHTNDAPTAIPRLIDLGVRPFLLSNAVNAIIAQRLVRIVCPHCAVDNKPDAQAMAEVKRRLATVPAASKDAILPEQEWMFLVGKGCQRCNNTGFAGRVGIFEVFTPSEDLEQMAIDHVPVARIREKAIAEGMMTMEQDGLIKALTGITTIDEVWRVARDL